MRLPKRCEKGFTLVELLIVLAILAVLAAVVIPNITGLFGRGAEQAYETDEEAIQTACATFYFDIHDGYDATNNMWLDNTGDQGHWYPTRYGNDSYADVTGTGLTLDIDDAATDDPNNPGNWLVCQSDGATQATDANVHNSAIWMGLLVYADGTVGGGVDGEGTAAQIKTERGTTARIIDGEKGPYLNEIAESAGNENGGDGSYVWVVGKNGKVYGIYDPDPGTADSPWYCGFSGDYP